MTNALIEENIHLADQCARKWRRYDSRIEYDEYFQTACMGLIRAARRWNPEGNAKFSTYAYFRMDGEVKKMRTIHYTGKKENGVLVTWVLIDHPPGSFSSEDADKWVDKHIGHYEHNIEFIGVRVEEEDPVDGHARRAQSFLRHYIEQTRATMRKHGISITRLAQCLGISQPTLSRWLSNDTRLTNERRKLINLALTKEIDNA